MNSYLYHFLYILDQKTEGLTGTYGHPQAKSEFPCLIGGPGVETLFSAF